jgi:uncharacterized membrane protein YbhN (UPF0104 family)
VVVAGVVSVALLALLFQVLEPQDLRDAFDAAWLPGLAAVLVIHGMSLFVRIYRWRGLLDAADCGPDDPTPAPLVVQSAFFGWLINLVLPWRVGDLARPAMYTRRSGLPFSRILGTTMVERAADLATLALLVLVALFLIPREAVGLIELFDFTGEYIHTSYVEGGLDGGDGWTMLVVGARSGKFPGVVTLSKEREPSQRGSYRTAR